MKNFKKLNDETIIQFAEQIGLDMQQFHKDFNDSSLNEIINQDMRLGKKVNVRGVPALFVNGRAVKKYSEPALSQVIEQELKKEK